MCAIVRFCGKDVDPYAFHVDDFQRYLSQVGVKYFSADEVTRPYQQDIAAQLGIVKLLPDRAWWPRGAALFLLADIIRSKVGSPVHCRNWYRSQKYNSLVGGVHGSTHLTAHAVDLDYKTKAHRRIAERFLDKLWTTDQWLDLGIGLGAKTTHIDIFHRRRIWEYPSYKAS